MNISGIPVQVWKTVQAAHDGLNPRGSEARDGEKNLVNYQDWLVQSSVFDQKHMEKKTRT